jgi:RimJ/RimL family protein N-acetyltransferase
MNTLSVTPLSASDVPNLIRYWLEADAAFLEGMGVDLSKMPSQSDWENSLQEQLSQAIPDKKSFCVIWKMDGQAVGHSNINKIQFGKEAFMHLHLWRSDIRQQGAGSALVKMSLPFFFDNYQLETLFCEPYALNPAPNKTLEKVGFQFVKEYITTPGWLNFEQPVKLWALSRERYTSLQ